MSPTNPLLCRLFFRSGRGYRCISKNYNSITKNSKYIKVSINFVITITNILDIYIHYINECVVPTCCQCFLCHSQEPRIVGLVSPIERCHPLQGLCHRLPRKNENLTRQQNQQDLRQQMKYYEKITWNNIWKLNFHTCRSIFKFSALEPERHSSVPLTRQPSFAPFGRNCDNFFEGKITRFVVVVFWWCLWCLWFL